MGPVPGRDGVLVNEWEKVGEKKRRDGIYSVYKVYLAERFGSERELICPRAHSGRSDMGTILDYRLL